MSDQTIQCVECGNPFTWSAGEQQFYREKGLAQPKHCPECRSHRRAERITRGLTPGWSRTSKLSLPDLTQSSTRRIDDGNSDRLKTYIFWSVLLVGATVATAVSLWFLITWLDEFQSYLIAINLVAFLMYGLDKLLSKLDTQRVPERILIISVFFLGFIGTELGRRVFHHKTKDIEFRKAYWAAFIVESILMLGYLVLVIRR